MKKLLLFFLALTVACSSGDDSSDNNGSDSCNITASLTTLPITNIQQNNASVNGVIELTSDCEIPNNTVQGFVYSTSIQPTINDNVVNANGIQVSALLSDLTPLQTYYVRTFVTNNEIGTEYGNEVSFQAGNPIYLADNGITIKAYEWAQIGEVGEINGTSYTIVDRGTLGSMINNNEDVTTVCTSRVQQMANMFSYATAFNQNIANWDVSNVTNMSFMFIGAISFNQDISSWDVSNVTNMNHMFDYATAFNQNIANWDVSNVTSVRYMFSDADSFNQPIGNWDVSNVTDMVSMFRNTIAFNQDISNWDVSQVINCGSFDANTPQWTQPKPNFTNCTP